MQTIGNIESTANVIYGKQIYQSQSTSNVVVANSVSIDCNKGNIQSIDLGAATGNVIVSLTNHKVGTYIFAIKQHATTVRSVSFSPVVDTAFDMRTVGINGFATIVMHYDGTQFTSNSSTNEISAYSIGSNYGIGAFVVKDGTKFLQSNVQIDAGPFVEANWNAVGVNAASQLTYVDTNSTGNTNVQDVLDYITSTPGLKYAKYASIDALLADNNTHVENGIYLVEDAAIGTQTDTRVTSGFAYYQKPRAGTSISSYDVLGQGSAPATRSAFDNSMINLPDNPTNVQSAIQSLSNIIAASTFSGQTYLGNWNSETNVPFLHNTGKYDDGTGNAIITSFNSSTKTAIVDINEISTVNIGDKIRIQHNTTNAIILDDSVANIQISGSNIMITLVDGTNVLQGHKIVTANKNTSTGEYFSISEGSEAITTLDNTNVWTLLGKIISNGSSWFCVDNISSTLNASDISFDDTVSNLQATNIQDAIIALNIKNANKAFIHVKNSELTLANVGKPTIQEIQSWNNSLLENKNLDTLLFYTGDDSENSTITYCFIVDISGKVVKIYAPVIDELGFVPAKESEKSTDFSEINDITYPTTSATDTRYVKNSIIDQPNGIASLNNLGKISADKLPAIATTEKILASETSFTDFLVEALTYTFESGDVIIIETLDSKIEHYFYWGPNKQADDSYSLINPSTVDFSDIVNAPSNLSDFVDDIGATDVFGFNTIYVNATTGDDNTALINNLSKPFATLNSAMTAYVNNPEIEKIEILSNDTYSLSVNTNIAGRNFVISSEVNSPTVNLIPSNPFNSSGFTFTINAPNATVNFSNGYNPSSSSRTRFYCYAKNFTLSNGSSFGYNNHIEIECSSTTTFDNVDTQTVSYGEGNSLKSDTIILNSSNILSSRNWEVDFNKMEVTGNCYIHGGGIKNINHGSVTGNGKVFFNNIQTININYKLGSTITSADYHFNAFNAPNATVNITGNVVFNSTIVAASNYADNLDVIVFKNASVTAPSLARGRFRSGIKLDNSTITLTTNTLMSVGDLSAYNPLTIASPILTIKGMCFINTPNDDDDLIVVQSQTNLAEKPIVDISEGILYTTGKINRGLFDINEKPFNQYFETSRKGEVIIRDKEQLLGVLDNTKTYIIDGVIELTAGEYIEVPAGGNLTINGYGLEASNIIKNVAGESIFKSPIGGSGGLQMDAIKFTMGTPTTSCFDLTDATGFNAVECVKVNFEGSGIIGTLNNYRQGLWTNIGVFGLSDGLTFEGTWVGGFVTNTVIVRNLSGTAGSLFKKGTSLAFNSRFTTDGNIDIPTGWSVADFENSNFINDNSFQVQGAFITRAGVIDDTDTGFFPNIDEEDDASDWRDNIGVPNSALPFQKIKSPDGTVYKLTVDNTGTITATAV